MKLYIAGKWDDHVALSALADQVEHDDLHTVTHRWMNKNIGLSIGYDALADIRGVQKCEIFVAVFTDPTYPYRGTFTELGAALATEKLVFLVCPADTEETKFSCRTNVFFHHPHCTLLQSWDEFLQWVGVTDKNGEAPKKRKM